MGLDISVGYLAELAEYDTEGLEQLEPIFRRVSDVLVAAGLKPHQEPTSVATADRFSCQMWGYSGLHYLRRIAAYDAMGQRLPPPGTDDASDDPVLARYYEAVVKSPSGFRKLFRIKEKPLAHQHLILHSDAEGYYIPQDFPEVVFPDKTLGIPGEMIGSTQRLYAECKRLAALLELPLAIDPESEVIWEAADSPESGKEKWQRYGVESFCCIRLLNACEFSIRSGAAIVFC